MTVITNWSGVHGEPDEVKLVTVKTTGNGFTNGDVFFGSGTGIGWLSPHGTRSMSIGHLPITVGESVGADFASARLTDLIHRRRTIGHAMTQRACAVGVSVGGGAGAENLMPAPRPRS